jgi:hypothetical protein
MDSTDHARAEIELLKKFLSLRIWKRKLREICSWDLSADVNGRTRHGDLVGWANSFNDRVAHPAGGQSVD